MAVIDLMRWHCIARDRPCRREHTLSINTMCFFSAKKAMTYDSGNMPCVTSGESNAEMSSVSKVEGAVDGWRVG